MIQVAKCLMAEAIDRASISHGSQVTLCFLVLALKKPARCNFLSRSAYSGASRPVVFIQPSVAIQSWSSGLGITMVLVVESACWALRNEISRFSDPATRGYSPRERVKLLTLQ